MSIKDNYTFDFIWETTAHTKYDTNPKLYMQMSEHFYLYAACLKHRIKDIESKNYADYMNILHKRF